MKYFLLVLIVVSFFSCKKQTENNELKTSVLKLPPPPPRVIDKRTLIGFACYYAGSKSFSVKVISRILKDKNFSKLKRKLYAINPAEKYLATIACEKLENKRLIKLTSTEFNQIKVNKLSGEKVTICGGCTGSEELSMKEMFCSKRNFLSKSIEDWLIEMIK